MSKTRLHSAAAIAAFAGLAFAGAAHAQQSAAGPTLNINGRVQLDTAYTDADYRNAAGAAFTPGVRTYVRRAFLGIDGNLTQRWRYDVKLDFSLGDATGQSLEIKTDDLFLRYTMPGASFLIGNHNAVAPMEDRTSSVAIPFNERSFLITAGGFGKRAGLGYTRTGSNWSAGIAVQSNERLEKLNTGSLGSESGLVMVRGTFDPVLRRTDEGLVLLHLGATARYRDGGATAGGGRTALSYSPGGLSTKTSNNARTAAFGQDLYYGAEMAIQYNAFGASAEYGRFDTGRGVEAGADGYYLDLFYSPTGESRNYNAADGSFRNVAPARPMGQDGGIGHVMLSARFESIDLSDPAFGANANTTSAYTLGVTLVPVDHVKFQLNYSTTDVDYAVNTGARLDNTIQTLTFRTQIDW